MFQKGCKSSYIKNIKKNSDILDKSDSLIKCVNGGFHIPPQLPATQACPGSH